MLGGMIDNCGCQAVYWTDKDGTEWAIATTANAAAQVGTEKFRPRWVRDGGIKACPRDKS